MLNEKQIYNRLNRAYENYYGDQDTDGWYGSDDETEWVFERDGQKHRLMLDLNTKTITIEDFIEEEWKVVRTLRDGNY